LKQQQHPSFYTKRAMNDSNETLDPPFIYCSESHQHIQKETKNGDLLKINLMLVILRMRKNQQIFPAI